MKISDLKVGNAMKEGNLEAIVTCVNEDSFQVQYPSGVLWTYRQSDLDNGTIEYFAQF